MLQYCKSLLGRQLGWVAGRAKIYDFDMRRLQFAASPPPVVPLSHTLMTCFIIWVHFFFAVD